MLQAHKTFPPEKIYITPSRCLIFLLFLSSLFVSACGGGGDNSTTTPPIPEPIQKTTVTATEASAFLNRATFGATRDSIDALLNSNLEDWLQQQMTSPPSLLLPYLQTLPDQDRVLPSQRVRGWWLNVVHGDDQLRQRVAFALSEIFVASDQNGFLIRRQRAMGNFYDLLVTQAFGNFRELLEQVTLNPVMGIYLSMLGNQKPDRDNNIRPDENYAREVMQLFTIGIVELNQDGSVITDAQGVAIATYDQDLIESFAHVFTGWTFAGATDFEQPRVRMLQPMQSWESYHDRGEKILFNGVTLPAGQSASDDLRMALDNLFAHNNVAPFISHKLIQRLVTSNPSPSYIERIAAVFNDNGEGVKGDLAAVITAILLDDEAMNGYQDSPDTFGKLREPLIRNAHLWRALDALTPSGELPFGTPYSVYGQSPQQAPHVFNFFYPDYQPPGQLADAGLVAPEFQIATANYLTGLHNAFTIFTLASYSGDAPDANDIVLELDALLAIANNHDALIDELSLIFMAGQMSPPMKNEILQYLDPFSNLGSERSKVMEVTFLILTSNEYAIQK